MRHLDPDKSLSELPLFKLIIVLLTGASIILFICVVTPLNLKADFTPSGFDFFLSTFKFPLSIAALHIPSLALLASLHRSEQTKRQIELTDSQNIFSNYYRHLEEFKKHMENDVKEEFPTDDIIDQY